jgi:hypothetical protein
MEEYLPSKHIAMSLNLSTTKSKNQKTSSSTLILVMIFLYEPKHRPQKQRKKCNYIKLKTACKTKGISKMFKELIQLNSKNK